MTESTLQMHSVIEIDRANETDSIIDDTKSQDMDTVYGQSMILQTAFGDNTKIYQPMNKRLTLYFIHLIYIYVLYVIGGGSTISIISIIAYSLELIFNITLIIIAMVRKHKRWTTFNQELNAILGIKTKDPRNIYNLDQISGNYVGLLFVTITINICVSFLANRCYAIYQALDGGADTDILVLVGSNFMQSFSSTLLLIILCCQFYAINDEVVLEMMKFKDEKILKIKDNKIGPVLNEKIYAKTLKSWQNQLLFKNRRMKFF